jgi:type II secretory pathway pseudopilin PulG
MTDLRRAGGFTLIEAMAAMAVLMIGAVGITSLESMGPRMNSDARMMTRATAVARDLVSQIQMWDYATETATGGRLTGNSPDFADTADAFETQDSVSSPSPSHSESDLGSGGGWLGIPTADIQGPSVVPVERYWNVAPYNDPTTGKQVGVNVGVIVRWNRGGPGAWRRIVLTTFVRDPSASTSP